MTRILHVPYCFYPDAVGGTEVYVEQLARLLSARGMESVIAAPRPGAAGDAYEHEGLRVLRYPVSPEVNDLSELYAMRSDAAAAAFQRILAEERPDVVHLHALTRGVGPELARMARRMGSRVVFTYHTPAVSCQRGSLLEDGVRSCDGRVDVARCGACSMGALGVPRIVRHALAAAPPRLAAALGRSGVSGGAWTALRMPELMSLRISAFREMIREADAVVAVSGWVRDLLRANGVPENRLHLSRQGVRVGAPELALRAPRPPGGPLRAAFFGRLDPLKGVELLLRALGARPELPMELDVYGVPQVGTGAGYEASLREAAERDPRVRFLPRVRPDDVVSTLRGYDVLLVPSQVLETGPLVVLEAFAAGIPVAGSRLGGIAELVRDGVDGVLVPAGSEPEWGATLHRLAHDRAWVERLRANVVPPRRMEAVAHDMEALYRELLSRNTSMATLAGVPSDPSDSSSSTP